MLEHRSHLPIPTIESDKELHKSFSLEGIEENDVGIGMNAKQPLLTRQQETP
jgi:hypothetical protein